MNSKKFLYAFAVLVSLVFLYLFLFPRVSSSYESDFSRYPVGFYGDSEEFFPLGDIKAGMTGYGKTVLEGKKISVFKVVVVGVTNHPLYDGGKIILAKLYLDHPYERSNVLAGMSGSPVYFLEDEKWKVAGALAYGYGNVPSSGMPSLIGITPIGLMIDQPSGVGLKEISEGNNPPSLLRPLELPITIGGAGLEAIREFSRDSLFRSRGLVFLPGNGNKKTSRNKSAIIEPKPGSSVSVVLVDGAVQIFSTGTVTYADQQKFLAFGHPFLQLGSVRMPAYESSIMTPLMGSKLVEGYDNPIGTITEDHTFAIEGVRTIDTTSMLPISFRTTLADSTSTREVVYDFRVIKNRLFSGILVNMSTRWLLSNVWPESQTATAVLSVDIQLKGEKEPIKLYRTTLIRQQREELGPFNFFSNVWSRLFAPLTSALDGLFGSIWDIDVEKITVNLALTEGIRAMVLDEAVVLDKADGSGKAIGEVRPGETVYLRMTVRDLRGEKSYVNFVPITIPKDFDFVTSLVDFKFLPIELYIQTGNNFSEKDILKTPQHLPVSREEFLGRFHGYERDPSRIYIQVVLPEERFDGKEKEKTIMAGELGEWQVVPGVRRDDEFPSIRRVLKKEFDAPSKNYIVDFNVGFQLKLLLARQSKARN